MKLPKKLLSIVLTIALVFLLIVPSILNSRVQAGTFTSASVTISDSRAAATSVQYDFAMTATVDTAIDYVEVYFCTTATGTCTAPTGFNTGTPTLSADNLSGTDRTTTKISAQDNTIRVDVTTPATQSPLGVTMSFTGITNSSTVNTSYFARVTTYSDAGITEIDAATMGLAVLDTNSIYVTATVASTLTFSVAAVTSGTVNGETITESGTTDPTIPFGIQTIATPDIAAHDLSVVTNADNGYTVTVNADATPPLVDASNNMDVFTGTNAAPTTWSSPAGTVENVNTAFFGYTTEDSTLGTGTTDRFTSAGGNKWAGTDTTAYEVMYNAAAPGSGGDTIRVGWQVEVNSYQPPGDYSGSVVLVATPTY